MIHHKLKQFSMISNFNQIEYATITCGIRTYFFIKKQVGFVMMKVILDIISCNSQDMTYHNNLDPTII